MTDASSGPPACPAVPQSAAVIVFARAPIPGAVKTRLIPSLGAQAAARLHRRMVQKALRAARDARCGPVQLWCAPDTSHRFFHACARHFEVVLYPQGEGDLGERMHRALTNALAEHDAAILIGSDAPALDGAYVCAALSALESVQAVFGPAEDGGYVLVGLKRPMPELFAGVRWGGPTVMAETRERLRRSGCAYLELDTLWDVDRPEDLARLNS